MNKFWGNYTGIVVQNDDPDKCGKVKVFIPHLSPTVYQKWTKSKANKTFKFLGNNIQSVLTAIVAPDPSTPQTIINVVEELKNILPWAECASPIVSESSSGRYNNTSQVGTVVDSSFISDINPSVDSTDIPGAPGALYENDNYRLSDAFTSAVDGVNRPNHLAYQYIPSTYSNKAKGAFAIPSVGSHVWCFFREGNPTKPVYFAASFGKQDWNGIFNSNNSQGIDYPGSYENRIETAHTVNTDTYRSKYVVNQKGGSLEIVNTDLKEEVKITHFSGSFKEFNNQANIELATKNDQKLVLNDSYSTVQGFKNEYTGKSYDEIVLRDKFKKIGKQKADLFDLWKQTYAIIQENKQLFEIKRGVVDNVVDEDNNIRVKRTSLLQTRKGVFDVHPVLKTDVLYDSLENDSTITYTDTATASSDGPSLLNVAKSAATETHFPSQGEYTAESEVTWGPGGEGLSTSTQDGTWEVEEQKDILKTLIELNMQALTNIEKDIGIGGSEIVQIAKHKIETIGLSVNDYGSIRYDRIGKILSSGVLINDKGVYVDKTESPLIELVHVQDLPGGNYTLNVCNRFNVLVGAGGINFKTLGQFNMTGSVVNVTGQQINIATQNEINIDAKTLNISAEIFNIRNKKNKQVYFDSNIGADLNVVVGGGLSVEGEMFVHHVTAPKEYQVTEQTKVFAKLLSGLTFACTINGNSATIILTEDSNNNLVECYPHSHVFANLPLTLKDLNSDVREDAKALNNSTERVVASPRVNQKK